MNKTKIFITTMLVAALAAGCSKEDTNSGSISGGTRNNVMRIFAGQFQNGNSKVTYNPNNVNAVNWVFGEEISLYWGNVEHYYDIEDVEGGDANQYCINFGETSYPFSSGEKIYAIYPAPFDPINNVNVTYGASKHEMVINSLEINGTGANSEMAFPMAAYVQYDGTNDPVLQFKHLTAGFRVQLTNTNLGQLNLYNDLKKLRIVALCDAPVVNHSIVLGDKTMTASWASEGDGTSLVLPAGAVGENEDDFIVANYSEMNFTVDEDAISGNNTDGYTMDFCIPVTIQKISSLVIMGYNENDEVIFKKTTKFNTERTLVVNHMYTLPVINL